MKYLMEVKLSDKKIIRKMRSQQHNLDILFENSEIWGYSNWILHL